MQIKIPFNWPNFRISSDWTLFLDRDGVINERIPGDYVKTWGEFRFLPGVLDALSILSNCFNRIFIVTNQAGIEKGILTHEELKMIHEQMMEFIIYHGGRVDEIYYCPYTGDLDPLCRKPNPGMGLEAKKDYPAINFNRSLMVGDADSDMAFGNNLGMKTILVGNKSDNNFIAPNSIPDFRLDSLTDVATYFKSL
jgi:D-glycero-D-manno-heptose 1,7-bisphosphate phosphatase